MYAELHCLTNFSFQHGASHPEELVKTASILGYKAIAITDRCSFSALVKAHVEAENQGIKMISGSEFHFDDGTKIILLAENLEAYKKISFLISKSRRRKKKGGYEISRSDLDDFDVGLLIWLPSYNEKDLSCASWLSRNFLGRVWIGVGLFYSGTDQSRLKWVYRLSENYGLRVTAAGDVRMHSYSRRPLLDVLTAIRLGIQIEEVGTRIFSNGEHYLRPIERLVSIYPSALLKESLRVAERCNFSLKQLVYEYPHEIFSDGKKKSSQLRDLAYAGAKQRFSQKEIKYFLARIDNEISLIRELGYEGYFLMVYDIICFAKSHRIFCQGRGSAANSVVCYCLFITEVSPHHIDMLFERFISRERNDPPDIDIDFEHERREEIIQYIYQKYGRERAAITASVVTYRSRSAVRDVAKVLGVDAWKAKELHLKEIRWESAPQAIIDLQSIGLDLKSHTLQHLAFLVSELIGFPRHLSQHVGGFVITDAPLSELVPIENAAMPDRTLIQWDKNDLETLGILKVDCLSLGILTVIRKTIEMVNLDNEELFSLHSIPLDDEETYSMIQKADTVGVFQIESRAQMSMLPRLKPSSYYDLVIQVAIVRPGPVQGNMVNPYLRRRAGTEKIVYPNNKVKEVLERTLGVPLFQEQIIRLATVVAGFTSGQADEMRRSMTSKKEGEVFSSLRAKFLSGMKAKGYAKDFSEKTFNQIKGFGGYGFPEAHAASFALLVYFSSWLKCHKPAAYTAALLNSQPMGFYAPSQLLQDARRHNVELLPVNVLKSDWNNNLKKKEDGTYAIRIGLRMIKGLGVSAGSRIIKARSLHPFSNSDDFFSRTDLSRSEMQHLSSSGALKSLVGNRHQANWQSLAVRDTHGLFKGVGRNEVIPLLPITEEGEEVSADYASLGFTLGKHPLSLLRSRLGDCVLAEILPSLSQRTRVIFCGLVIVRQQPRSANGVMFVTLEDDTGTVNLIIWPMLLKKYRSVILKAQLLSVKGVIQREGDVVNLIGEEFEDRTGLLGQLDSASRDFR